jgi:hypothetical protein
MPLCENSNCPTPQSRPLEVSEQESAPRTGCSALFEQTLQARSADGKMLGNVFNGIALVIELKKSLP